MGPYREPAEDVDAALDALEVAAFKASLVRRGRLVRLGLVLTLVGTLASVALLATLALGTITMPTHTSPTVRTPRCETHMLTPERGDPFPMTVCH